MHSYPAYFSSMRSRIFVVRPRSIVRRVFLARPEIRVHAANQDCRVFRVFREKRDQRGHPGHPDYPGHLVSKDPKATLAHRASTGETVYRVSLVWTAFQAEVVWMAHLGSMVSRAPMDRRVCLEEMERTVS